MSDGRNELVYDATLDPCDCCEGLPETDRFNRAGLPLIRYRLGTYGSFLEQLLAQIAQPLLSGGASLERLKTRSLDDGAIALLDAWAVVADVLTFYQERIANENYLRTATERRSVLELARAIGYELNPGVAASTYLAFTVETTPGSPEVVPIPQGVQVLSIPGQDELPQTFETTQDFEARPEWNQIRPRLTQPQNLAFQLAEDDEELEADQLYFWTADADLAPLLNNALRLETASLYFLGQPPNSAVLEVAAVPIEQIYLEGIAQSLKVGQRLLFVGQRGLSEDSELGTLSRIVLNVVKQPADDLTRIDFTPAPQPITYLIAQIAYILPFSTVIPTALPFTNQTTQTVLQQPIYEQNLQALLGVNSWSAQAFVAEAANPPPPPEISAETGVFVFQQQVNCFGHNAPRYEALPVLDETRGDDPYPLPSWDADPPTIWENSRRDEYTEHDIFLERSIPEIVRESWILLENTSGKHQVYQVTRTGETSLVDYALSGKSTGLSLANIPAGELSKPSDFLVRKTTVYAQSEKLTLALLPVESPLEELNPDSEDSTAEENKIGVRSIELESIIVGFQPGQTILVQGQREDARHVTVTEMAVIEEIIHEGANTTLYFQAHLQYRYVRNSVTLYGNVVLATHGETVSTVLGSGDGAQTHQKFTLKKLPLTYTSADTPTGAQSSLSIRVNNLLWEEAPFLYGLGSQDERYIVRIEDDGATTITFGDGGQGSRLPTGLENVTAVYRAGLGPEGEVPADSLTLLKKRPLGLKSVTNPLPATGAEAPEQLANARTNAPLTVLTLDRIVSRQDYEDFARSFAGIGKAQAIEIWNGFTEQVHITIAAANGEPVATDSQTYKNLKQAIEAFRDPSGVFRLASFEPRSFNLKGTLRLDPRFTAELVLEQIRTALLDAFSFTMRSFGQGVSAAGVITLIQSVSGVIAVDLDQLYRTDQPAGLNTFVGSDVARWHAASREITLAQLLLINPVGIDLEVNAS